MLISVSRKGVGRVLMLLFNWCDLMFTVCVKCNVIFKLKSGKNTLKKTKTKKQILIQEVASEPIL